MSRFELINIPAPLFRLIVWSFALHGMWEFFQCLFFYDMTGFGFWKGALWMISATVADVILTLFLVGGALWLQGRKPYISFVLTLIILGFLVAIGIEVMASVGRMVALLGLYAATQIRWHYAGIIASFADGFVALPGRKIR